MKKEKQLAQAIKKFIKAADSRVDCADALIGLDPGTKSHTKATDRLTKADSAYDEAKGSLETLTEEFLS